MHKLWFCSNIMLDSDSLVTWPVIFKSWLWTIGKSKYIHVYCLVVKHIKIWLGLFLLAKILLNVLIFKRMKPLRKLIIQTHYAFVLQTYTPKWSEFTRKWEVAYIKVQMIYFVFVFEWEFDLRQCILCKVATSHLYWENDFGCHPNISIDSSHKRIITDSLLKWFKPAVVRGKYFQASLPNQLATDNLIHHHVGDKLQEIVHIIIL
jgi:hypothetical protein